MEKGKRFLTKYGFQILLFAAVLAFFLLAGHDGPVLFDDSGSYIRIRWHEGVMPVYPLFLLANQCLFGNASYLWAVIIEQALLASFSVVFLEETLRKQFGLHPIEGVLLCVPALYPYTIEMPGAVMTQTILTEGIAYSLFYLFLIVLLKAVWKKSYVQLAGAFFMTLLLSAVRSQMQILFGVCGIVFLYLVCKRRHGKGKRQGLLRFCIGFAGCAAVSLSGVLLVLGIVRGYHEMLLTDHSLYLFGLKVQHPEIYEIVMEERRQAEAAQAAGTTAQDAQSAAEENQGTGQADQAEVEKDQKSGGAAEERQTEGTELQESVEEAEAQECPPVEVEEEETSLLEKNFSTSQYLTLIFSRGMYEADYEDAELFEDPVLKGLYLALYDAVDAQEERYAYAQEGLWMWKDIVGGIGKIGGICFMTPSEYYAEHAPEIIESEQFSDIRAGHLQTVGLTLIRVHLGRVLYHALMMLPQAFICTVFFQYAPLYLLCHLVTAFLYLTALGLMIWGYADKRTRKEGAEMMALILGTNVVMVLIISLVFFGQQRYLVYTFGPFYMAYYLLLVQLWRVRLRELFRKKFQKRNEEAQ